MRELLYLSTAKLKAFSLDEPRKFFSPPHRWAYASAVMLRALVRNKAQRAATAMYQRAMTIRKRGYRR